MIRKLLVIACLLALTLGLVLTAGASEYDFQNGYYWRGGIAHTRAQESYQSSYVAYYWSGCGWSPYTAYRTEYRYAYTPVRLNIDAPDLEAQIIQLAAGRDAAVLRIAAKQQKSAAALALIDKLGLAGNFALPNYGGGVFAQLSPVAGYGTNYQLSAAGVQGNTTYGYSGSTYNSVSQTYGAVDLNALYQQASRLTEGAQGLAGSANTEFSARVREAGDGAARVAEIQARAAAAAQALRATEPQVSSKTETRIVTAAANPATSTPGAPPLIATRFSVAAWQKLSGPQKCLACHSGETLKGGFDIAKYHPSITPPEDMQRVLAYLMSPADAKRHCPKDGVTLTPEEIGQFIRDPAAK